MPGFGRNAKIGWVEEPTWGTPVTPATKWAELISEQIKTIALREPRPVLRGLSMREGNQYDAKQGAAGAFPFEMNYGGMLRLIEHLFGDSSIATVIDEAAVRFSHTATRKDTIMTGKGLSIYVDTDIDASLPERQYAGWKMDGARITVDPNRNTQVEFRGAGKLMPVDVARQTPTFPLDTLYVAGHQATIEIDDAVRNFDKVEIDIANGLNLDKRIIGSKNIDEPVRGSDQHSFQVTGTIVGDGVLADLTKFRSGTLFKLEVLHKGPTLGTDFFRSDITLLKCEVVDDPFNVTDAGIIKSTIPFRALEPTSGEMIEWLTRNDEASVA